MWKYNTGQVGEAFIETFCKFCLSNIDFKQNVSRICFFVKPYDAACDMT